MKFVKLNKKAIEVDEEKFNRNTREELNKDITLREVKEMVGSTRQYKRAPSAKLLRCFGEIVAAGTLSDCRMEVYSCGFAVYQAFKKVVVIRMELIDHLWYEGEPSLEMCNQNIGVLEMPWMIGVMMRGQDVLEQNQYRKDTVSLVYLSDMVTDNDDEDIDVYDFDSGVNVEAEVLDSMEVQELLSLLTQRQRECAEMYCELGMTEREIAKVLGTSFQNIDQTLRRARKTLGDFLKKIEEAG